MAGYLFTIDVQSDGGWMQGARCAVSQQHMVPFLGLKHVIELGFHGFLALADHLYFVTYTELPVKAEQSQPVYQCKQRVWSS